jgi:hypothetical protein
LRREPRPGVADSLGERAIAIPGDVATEGVPAAIVEATLDDLAASTSS